MWKVCIFPLLIWFFPCGDCSAALKSFSVLFSIPLEASAFARGGGGGVGVEPMM